MSARGRRHRAVLFPLTLAISSAALFAALRVPRLLALPIFTDEAIYLRYGKLIAQDPLGNAWVSLVDPKPPLHYWLLASVIGLSANPLLPARLLSVGAGLAMLAVVWLLGGEVARLRTRAVEGHGPDATAPIAVLLFIGCPFLAFYQRMAMAESLVVLESVVVAWLSLRLARRAEDESARDPVRRDGVALGVVLGLTFLTKQNASYLLALLPLLAIWAYRPRRAGGELRRRAWAAAGMAIAVAVAIWSPILFVDHGPGLRDRVFFRSTQAEVGGARPGAIARDAFLYLFVPVGVRDAPVSAQFSGLGPPADGGWLWHYLTPPIELAAVGGLLWLVARRQRRLAGFLAGWAVSQMLPLTVSRYAFSRYALFAVPPLLLSAACLLAALWREAARPQGLGRRALAAGLLLTAVVWPFVETAALVDDPEGRHLVRSDRWQYHSGWPAGLATERALEHLRSLARHGPMIVVTNHLAGVPTDAVWVAFSEQPGVSVFFAEWLERLPALFEPKDPDWFLLRTRFHHWDPGTVMVRIPTDVPVFFVAGESERFSISRRIRGAPSFRELNPAAKEVARYTNPRLDPDLEPGEVVILKLR